MPILATLGARVSNALHRVVFSFPSPHNASDDADAAPSVEEGRPYASMSALEQAILEPGEPRALAGGIGPLSFAGSGYGIALVLMVCSAYLQTFVFKS
jgi:hypothetical protein